MAASFPPVTVIADSAVATDCAVVTAAVLDIFKL